MSYNLLTLHFCCLNEKIKT